MSRWSDSERTGSADADSGRSAARPTATRSDRAQVEPLAALVAVFAVGAALTAYTGVLDATVPSPDRNVAEPTVERVERAVGDETGVVTPKSLAEGLRAGPDGYALNLTLRSAGRTWHAGPTSPPSTDTAEVAVSVQVGLGQIRPGRLRAEVWS
jgi:hypothetical protein